MKDYRPINSSNLESAGYDGATGTMVVRFKNDTAYKYENVPLDLWKEFEATFDGTNGKSAGKFFHSRIRNLQGEKIED